MNGGKSIARFLRPNVPESLRFAAGFEPDFRSGLIDVTHSHSRLYEGAVARYRILSRNGRMQYLFFAAPRLAWIGYPQPLTTELSSFGVRTVDVTVPDDLVVPGDGVPLPRVRRAAGLDEPDPARLRGAGQPERRLPRRRLGLARPPAGDRRVPPLAQSRGWKGRARSAGGRARNDAPASTASVST